jgi:hypothetical protein|tara:strand:+ start:760 stop:1341 length:582 start_codon:yes stop_codon:yes gene_type:complete
MAIVKTNPLDRQPDNLDLARPTQFRFSILKIPNTEYFIQEVNLPGIAFSGDAVLNTRFTSLNMMGDTVNYEPLEISFSVQENLSNWREIHDWMVGIGFPENTAQFADAISDAKATRTSVPSRTANVSTLQSDATLMIMTNKNNPTVKVNFKNVYPTSLSGVSFDTKDTDAQNLTATMTMNYDYYNLEVLGSKI